jgi:hypothetical protein
VFESWSLAWREEFGLMVLENRKVFGLEKDGVTRECRRLRTEELYDLYSLPNIIRRSNKEE